MSGVQCLKREGCIVMLAFLGGIVLTNLLGANQQIHGQLLNQTFLQQYAYQKVDGNQLFGHVVMVRMQMLVLIFLLGRAVDGKVFSVLAKSMLSAGFGFLLVVGIMEYGGYGCLIILAGFLPHWIHKTAALNYYANSKKTQSTIVGWNTSHDPTRQQAEAQVLLLLYHRRLLRRSFRRPTARHLRRPVLATLP